MFKNEHTYLDNYMYLKEVAEAKAEKEKQITERKMKETEDLYDALNKYRKNAELKQSEISNFSEDTINMHLQTVFEAIYISALQKVAPLTESEIAMAQSLVKNYIKEHGGANAIMNKNSGKTYLLDFMFECAKTAHDTDMALFLEADEEEKAAKEARKKVKEDQEKDNMDADENESGEDIKVGDSDGDGDDDAKDVDKDPDDEKEDKDKNLTDDLEIDDDESEDDKNEKSDNDKESKDKSDSEEESDKDDSKEKSEDDEDEESKSDNEEAENDSKDKSDDTEAVDKSDNDKESKDKSDSEEESEKDDSEEKLEDDKFMIDDLDDEDFEKDNSDTDEDFKSEDDNDSDNDTDDGFSAADGEIEKDPEAEEEETSTDNKDELKGSKEDMFKKLENDETVDNAVDIIAKRIADAEAEFIKRNAEDKQKIEKIADKIDERIQSVTQSDKSDEEKDKEKEELKTEATRTINEVKYNRLRIVFEEMVENNANYIVKNKALLESYTGYNNKLDFTKVVDSTRVQYGFLEFLNTVQLEKVDSKFILDIINERI